MKTNNLRRKTPKHKGNKILEKLSTKTINLIARVNGFTRRNAGKIRPKNLIIGFMIMASKRRNTYADWALEIGLLEGKTITKQALNGRMKRETQLFIKSVVESTICKQPSQLKTKKLAGVLKHFNCVKIEDSTILHLPDALAKEFPGNISRGMKKSQAKILAMHNLTENKFEFLHVHSFSNNDQSLAYDSLSYLKKGDLCIRDLGFLVLGAVEQFIKREIYFISRKNYQTKIFDIATGQEIDLLKSLQK